MLFQCSARLTLIWLSGSALLRCQAVWAVVKLFEGGWRRGVGCLCQAEMGCGDAGPASVPRLSHMLTPSPSLHFTTTSFSFPASAASTVPPFSPRSLSPAFTFWVSHMQGQAHPHALISFSFSPKASLKELWLCGLEEIQRLCHFVGFSPQLPKHNTAALVSTKWDSCQFHRAQRFIRCHSSLNLTRSSKPKDIQFTIR